LKTGRLSSAVALLSVLIATGALGDNTVTIGSSPMTDVSDWDDEYCVADTSCGANSSQNDGKGACIASNFPTSTHAYLRYDYDEVGLSGNNTMDGCWLVDVDEDDLVDRALCFTIGSSGGLANSIATTLYSCSGSANSCGGSPAPLVSDAMCAFNNATPDGSQLLDCDVGDNDLAVECSVSLSDMGWTAGDTLQLIQGCSTSSAQPTSSTFECFGEPGSPLIIDPNTGGNMPVELQFFTIE